MKKLRTAVIGLGWAGTVHAQALATMPGIDLIALADPDPARRAAFPGLRTVKCISDLLDLGLDYCVVATPTATHETIALRLADAGISSLIEKPLAPTLEAAWRIGDAFQRASVIAAVGHTERHNAATAELARRLRSGEFGTLWQITTCRQGPHPGRISDVGVARDLAVHDLDLAAWLAQQPITSITAAVACIVGPHEDTATATARLHNGLLSHLHANWITPFKHRTLQVHTPAGVLTADAVNLTLTLHPNTASQRNTETFVDVHAGQAQSLPVPDRPAPFTVENQIMRDALHGHGTDGLVTLADGAAAVAATEALLTAARTGQATNVMHRQTVPA
ncbi:Gfo/Idh/MocA family oxidoreductase (plasmid) [Nonomuraea sp. NBC_00507]|uniref:Gfo/Idh/MocA family protein n=1 Tax=Nonomuraea sp. NBC_00507 TaxID=2976002 RepID=UPI002E19CD4D